MQGRVFKRCKCQVRRDEHDRRLACGKSHGSWCYVVDVPAVAGEKRRQVTKGGFATRREADAALAAALTRSARGERAAPRRLSTADYLEDWLVTVRPTMAVSGWSNYRSLIRLYVIPPDRETAAAGSDPTGAQRPLRRAAAGRRQGRPAAERDHGAHDAPGARQGARGRGRGPAAGGQPGAARQGAQGAATSAEHLGRRAGRDLPGRRRRGPAVRMLAAGAGVWDATR